MVWQNFQKSTFLKNAIMAFYIECKMKDLRWCENSVKVYKHVEWDVSCQINKWPSVIDNMQNGYAASGKITEGTSCCDVLLKCSPLI